jgi:NADH-quinone oxidoreductase subunit J
LLNIRREVRATVEKDAQRWGALLTATFFAGLLGMLLWRSTAGTATAPLGEGLVSMRGLARELFTDYLLPFEMVGLLLLAAVVAATMLARRPPAPPTGEPDA